MKVEIPNFLQSKGIEGADRNGQSAEQSPQSEQEKQGKSRLSIKTREFVQLAFAHGAADVLDERRKWLLVRYNVDEQSTHDGIKKYAGVKTQQQACRLVKQSLTMIWEASPPELQKRFPKEEVIRGKLPGLGIGHKIKMETIAKMRSVKLGKQHTDETKNKISAANKWRKHSEKSKANMSIGQRERRRREREEKEIILFENSKSQKLNNT